MRQGPLQSSNGLKVGAPAFRKWSGGMWLLGHFSSGNTFLTVDFRVRVSRINENIFQVLVKEWDTQTGQRLPLENIL